MKTPWHRFGESNLAFGGGIFTLDPVANRAHVVRLRPYRETGGPENQYWIETGHVDLDGDAQPAPGVELRPASRQADVESALASKGVERDGRWLVQLGPEPIWNTPQWKSARPTVVLRRHTNIERYLYRFRYGL